MATTSRKIRVRPTSRASSAISLGVFWRLAPRPALSSRRACSPGIVGHADPDLVGDHSGIAGHAAAVGAGLADDGADSPVMAASLTEAIPAMTSPSAGIISPLRTSTRSPSSGWWPGIHSPWPSFRIPHLACLKLAHARLQAVGPPLATAFCQGLGEVGKPQGQPQPGSQLPGQAGGDSRQGLTQQGLHGRHHCGQPEGVEQYGAAKQRPGVEAIEASIMACTTCEVCFLPCPSPFRCGQGWRWTCSF